MQYLHRDHLGSVVATTNEQGQVTWRGDFSAWGQRRSPAGTPANAQGMTRGFTGHEMLDDLGLVHMNGRIYDPALGRFLSADPTIQAAHLAQNYDRYAYVLNNPLSLTDPSGFNFFDQLNGGFGSAQAFGRVLGADGSAIFAQVVGAAAAVTTYYTGGNIYAAAAVGGFTQAHVQSNLSGGSALDGLVAGAESAAVGVVTAYAGTVFPNGISQIAAHAVIGGAYNELQGGSFGEGALSGAVSQVATNFMPSGNGFEARAIRIGVAAIAGGTAAEIGGGKFANGALTGAFLQMYNGELHNDPEKQAVENIGKSFTSPEVAIDYDGDPYAYAPRNSKLVGDDYLKNAMANGKLSPNVILFKDGKPVINSEGYYVSKTSFRWLGLAGKRQSDFVNGQINVYIALGNKQRFGAVLGYGLFKLENLKNGLTTTALYVDSRGTRNVGIEMSPAAARSLGITFSKRGVTSSQTVRATFLGNYDIQ